MLALMRPVNQELAYSDAIIKQFTRPAERVQRLRGVPSMDRGLRRRSSRRGMKSSAFAGRTRSRRTWAWCPGSGARGRTSSGAGVLVKNLIGPTFPIL